MLRRLITGALALTLMGCAGASTTPSPTRHPSTSATPTPAATPTPSPSPSASADNQQVSVTSSGVGDYDLQAYPVAVLDNLATGHTANGVVAQFSVKSPSGSFSLDSVPVSLAPAQTLAVAALCTDSCQGATGVTVTVTVGSWSAGGASSLTASSASYACGSPCAGGHGYEGDASGTMSGDVSPGSLVNYFAACFSSSGAIVGGGWRQTVWIGSSSSISVSVPVLVTAQPASCQLYASVA